jgi:hypothetical protein
MRLAFCRTSKFIFMQSRVAKVRFPKLPSYRLTSVSDCFRSNVCASHRTLTATQLHRQDEDPAIRFMMLGLASGQSSGGYWKRDNAADDP